MTEVAIGIDVGGTNTKFGILTRDGRQLAHGTFRTDAYETIEPYLKEMNNHLKKALQSLDEEVTLVGIGVGAPNGNYYSGNIEEAPNLKWKGLVPFTKMFGKYFKDVQILLTNDANAAALGEMIYGGAMGMQDFIVITLGTGLGSGIVSNGELIYGSDGFAGELGHVIVNPGGRFCGCGRRGCLETYVSATGIKRTVFKLLADYNEPSELRKYSYDDLTAEMIMDAALEGDALAREAFEYTGQILGTTLANTVAHTSPEAIFLFGGLARSGDLILEPTRQFMEKNLLRIYKGKVEILMSGMMDKNAAVYGAAALVWQEAAPKRKSKVAK